MKIATASSYFTKRFLQVIALFAVLGIASSAASQTFTVSPNSSGGSAVTLNGILGSTITKAFTITNTTGVPTTVFASVVGNTNSGLTLPGLGYVTVAGNSTGTLNLNYTPLTTATQNAVLHLFNGVDSVSVALQGLVQRSFNTLLNGAAATTANLNAGVGAHDTEQFTLVNTSNGSVTVGSSLSGSGASAFSLSGTTSTLDSGASRALKVFFNPTASGTYNATLKLVNGLDTQLVNLVGSTASAAGFTVSPLSLPGQPVTLNTGVGQTASQTFTVVNTTTQPITVNGSLSGSGSSAFNLGQNSATIAGGSTGTFTLNFAPTTTGVQNAVLKLASATDSVLVNVQGIATQVGNTVMLTANQAFVEFNNVLANTQECRTIRITNPGNTAVSLREVTFVGVTSNGNEFTIGNNFNNNTQIAAGGTDSIVVCFMPTSAGQTVLANLKLQYRGLDSAMNGVTMIRLEGNAQQATDSLNLNLVDNLDFDAMPGETECQTLRLTNPSALLGGTAYLTLADTNAGFDLSSGDQVTLGPLGTGFVTICYTGDSLNPNTSTNLNIVVLGQGGTFLGNFNVGLTGETEFEIDEDITDSIITGNCFRVLRGGNLGPIVIGGATNQTITIQNRTNQTATINGGTIMTDGQATTDFALASGTTFPITIAPFGSTTLNVGFNPMDSTRTAYHATLDLDVAGTSCTDISVNLTGVGLPAVAVGPQGSILDTLGIISNGGFNGNVAVIGGECESGVQTIAFQNNLNTAVTISGLTFTGAQSSNFTVIGSTPALPATLQAGDIINIQVQFNCGPNNGFYTANLNLQTQGGIAPIVIPFQTIQQGPASVARAEESGVTISVSPNPTRGIVRVEVKDAASANVEILNVLGQTVATGEGTSFYWNGETAGVSAGIYIVRVSGTNAAGREFVETRQIVVE
jgi:hypothetical protein